MIRMLLGTMQEKLVDSQATGFELENLLVGYPQNDRITPKEAYATSQLHPR